METRIRNTVNHFICFLSVSSHVLLESVTHLKQMEKLVDPLELS